MRESKERDQEKQKAIYWKIIFKYEIKILGTTISELTF